MSDKPIVMTYTRLHTKETCPKKFYHLEIERSVKHDPMGEKALAGQKAHKKLENAMLRGLDMPYSYKYLQWVLDEVRKHVVYRGEGYSNPATTILTECKFGINKKMQACGFFDSDVKFRGVADLILVNGTHAVIYDYKDGNPSYADTTQLDYMALCFMLVDPKVETIDAQLLFTRHPEEKFFTESYVRKDLVQLRKMLLHEFQDIARRKASDDWPAVQTGLCKNYCPVPKSTCPKSGRV